MHWSHAQISRVLSRLALVLVTSRSGFNEFTASIRTVVVREAISCARFYSHGVRSCPELARVDAGPSIKTGGVEPSYSAECAFRIAPRALEGFILTSGSGAGPGILVRP